MLHFHIKEGKIISQNLSTKLQKMVGFRNIAVHDYKALNLELVKSMIENQLEDFWEFTKLVLGKYSK
ncbi:MAG: hypothetical protein K1060chlam1_01447 [Candidatus Anoxychlamydiales bacterium]|nr:hypothetical protein [Candidatus Anoxychlamydiales bacterium]